MVEIGSVIRARVARVEPYGIYLSHGDQTLIVLAPELSWSHRGEISKRVRVGDEFDVLVVRYNYEKKEIVGSIRRLHQEENPYRQLSRLEAGEVLPGKVLHVHRDGVTVGLPNGARGTIPGYGLHQQVLQSGDAVHVTIAGLDVEEGTMTLNLLRRDAAGLGQVPAPELAGIAGTKYFQEKR